MNRIIIFCSNQFEYGKLVFQSALSSCSQKRETETESLFSLISQTSGAKNEYLTFQGTLNIIFLNLRLIFTQDLIIFPSSSWQHLETRRMIRFKVEPLRFQGTCLRVNRYRIFTTFEVSIIFQASGAVVKNGSSFKPKQIKLVQILDSHCRFAKRFPWLIIPNTYFCL